MNKNTLMIFFGSFFSIFSFLRASEEQENFYKTILYDGNVSATKLVQNTIDSINGINRNYLEQVDQIIFNNSNQKLTSLLVQIKQNEDVWTNLAWGNLKDSCHRIHRRCCVLKDMVYHFAVLTAIKTGKPRVIGSKQIIFFSKDLLDSNKKISAVFDLYFMDVMQQLTMIRRDPAYLENNQEALELLNGQLIDIERQFLEENKMKKIN